MCPSVVDFLDFDGIGLIPSRQQAASFEFDAFCVAVLESIDAVRKDLASTLSRGFHLISSDDAT